MALACAPGRSACFVRHCKNCCCYEGIQMMKLFLSIHRFASPITQDWACFMALRCPRSSMRFGDCFYMDSRMLSPWLRLCMGFAVLFIATTPFVYAIFNCSICFKHAQLLQALPQPIDSSFFQRLPLALQRACEFQQGYVIQIFQSKVLRGTSKFLTSSHIIIHCFDKSSAQASYRVAVESDDIMNTRDMTNKALIFIAIFNAGHIAFIGHGFHGLTPECSRNVRASRI